MVPGPNPMVHLALKIAGNIVGPIGQPARPTRLDSRRVGRAGRVAALVGDAALQRDALVSAYRPGAGKARSLLTREANTPYTKESTHIVI